MRDTDAPDCGYAELQPPCDDAALRGWLRTELQRRYNEVLAAPLPERLLELLPCA